MTLTNHMSNNPKSLTKDEIDNAANTNLVDYLDRHGFELKKRGKQYFFTHNGNDSLVIFGANNHMFKHFSSGHTGNAIKFCREHLNMNFAEAVESLNGGRFVNTLPPVKKTVNQNPKVEFVAPNKDDSYKRLFAYLLKERLINTEVVKFFVNEKILYPTKEFNEKTKKEYRNIAFLVKDYDGNDVGAIKRSYFKDGFKGNHENGNTIDYGFNYTGDSNSNRVFLFESPIDMLSYISNMEQKGVDWKKDNFIATGGVNFGALEKFIDLNQNISNIYLCHDNDKAGHMARLKIISTLTEKGYKGKFVNHIPHNKDWNEDLKKGVVSRKTIGIDEIEKIVANFLKSEKIEKEKLRWLFWKKL